MYEKLMYKVDNKDNKLVYRLQDFTKNDNVDESVFHMATNKQGKSRLESKVIVIHLEEFETLKHKYRAMKEHVETLEKEIMQKNVEIERLENEIADHKQADKDEEFNILLKTRELEKQHQKDIDKLKETHTNQLSAIGETHDKQLRKLRAQYTAKIDDAKHDLIETIDANDKARDKIRVEMLELKESHKQEVIALQNTHHKEVETLQHEHSNELQTIRDQHTYDIETLKEANTRIKQEHLKEINELKEKHHVEVDDMRTKFLRMLASEHAKDMSDLNECEHVPFYIKPFARGHLQALDEFKKRKSMNTPQKIVETYELAGEKEKI